MRTLLLVRLVGLVGLVLLSSLPAAAQDAPVNPRAWLVDSPDHERLDAYEVLIILPDGSPVQALTVPATDTAVLATTDDGTPIVRLWLNVHPIAFGQYRVVVRAVAGAERSDHSEASDLWRRAPSRPGRPRAEAPAP